MKGTLLKIGIAIGIGSLTIAASEVAYASSLIGDSIQFEYLFPDSTSVYQNSSTIVAAGNSDAINAFNTFSFDPEASGFRIPSFFYSSSWIPSSFNGFELSSLDFDDSSSITGYTLATNMVGLDASRFVFTENTFSVNWQGLSFDPSTYVNVDFQTNASTTPVPTPALLPGLVGLGVAVLRKRKQSQGQEAAETAKV